MQANRTWPLVVMLAGTVLAPLGGASGDEPVALKWEYVADAGDGPFSRPVFQALELVAERPDGITERVQYRGSKPLYAQLRYGTADSTRVLIVVDETARGDFDLYVDRGRDRAIDKSDFVEGTGRDRATGLDVEVVHGEVATHLPRTVWFRLGATGRTIAVATAGFAEGRAALNGQTVAVRRVDGDANGLFSDVRDRLWIDTNADGHWDPIAEQFPYTPVLRLGEHRFAVRADRLGERLALEEIVGTGSLKVELPSLAENATVQKLDVMLVGEDGSAFALRGDQEAVSLPVGRYALGTVTVSVLDGKSREPWTFVFSRSGGEQPQRWYEVRKDERAAIDPIGRLRFELHVSGVEVRGGKDTCRPGESLVISPRLYTGDGLLINSSGRGEVDRYSSYAKYNCATTRLVSSDATALATALSGFA